jgi:hypothetical protein
VPLKVAAIAVRGRWVTSVEQRAPWREEYGPEWTSRGVARLRFTTKVGVWTLYWSDCNGRW